MHAIDGTKLITRRNSLLLSDDGRKFVIIAPVRHIVVLVELGSEGHHARGLEEGKHLYLAHDDYGLMQNGAHLHNKGLNVVA